MLREADHFFVCISEKFWKNACMRKSMFVLNDRMVTHTHQFENFGGAGDRAKIRWL